MNWLIVVGMLLMVSAIVLPDDLSVEPGKVEGFESTPYFIADGNYSITNVSFWVSSSCEGLLKCGDGCCGGLSWADDNLIWVYNGNYSFWQYYDICVHERLHLELPDLTEEATELERIERKQNAVFDEVCLSFLETAEKQRGRGIS